MATLIEFFGQTGVNVYCRAIDPTTLMLLNQTLQTEEAYNAAHWTDYAIALTEQGATGYYTATFPIWVTAYKTYTLDFRQRAGATPNLAADGDSIGGSSIDYTATASSGSGSVVATYSDALLTTSVLYQTRLFASDTNVAAADFSDNELTFFLAQCQQVPELAAGKALRALAGDAARLATSTKFTTGVLGSDETKVYQALMQMAADIERKAPVTPLVSSPDLVFSMTSDGGLTIGTMDEW